MQTAVQHSSSHQNQHVLFSAQSHYNLANTRYILQERKFLTSAETEVFAALQVPQLQFKQHWVLSFLESSTTSPEALGSVLSSHRILLCGRIGHLSQKDKRITQIQSPTSHIPQATAQYTWESWVWCRIRYGATLALESKTTSSVPTRRPRKQRARNHSSGIPNQRTGLSKNTG